ncbi:NUDIX hydrolase [Desulfosediminicola sp.]|uniref:NUDIX hydrolase n=1 Tax=Desulfosediminicola sp. TaxID=2886825 RepID=UPI003AF24445
MNFCSHCGHKVIQSVPNGDDRSRFVCPNCGTIHYQNPKLVVGCIPEWQGNILLCKRNIEPRLGFWTLPAGYLENGESAREGAIRETYEETCARVNDLKAYFLADLISINQLYLMFRCSLVRPDFRATAESIEVRLFSEEEIPWNQIAFPVIHTVLKSYLDDRAQNSFPFRNQRLTQIMHSD